MRLSTFAAETKLAIHNELIEGNPPSLGSYDEALLREGRTKGQPQVGATRFEPQAVICEFVYPDPLGASLVFSVRVPTSERIVFMPVPDWVVESIWQGDVDGTYQFEADAQKMLETFRAELSEDLNMKWFGPRPPKRRE